MQIYDGFLGRGNERIEERGEDRKEGGRGAREREDEGKGRREEEQ